MGSSGREARRPLGRGEREALRVVEGVARRRVEAAVPHQTRKECGVHDGGRPPLVARTLAAGAHEVVALDADRDRLGVAESGGGRMASRAGVVGVQGPDLVEEEKAPEVGEVVIDETTEPRLEGRFDASREPGPLEDLLKLAVRSGFLRRVRRGGQGSQQCDRRPAADRRRRQAQRITSSEIVRSCARVPSRSCRRADPSRLYLSPCGRARCFVLRARPRTCLERAQCGQASRAEPLARDEDRGRWWRWSRKPWTAPAEGASD